MSDHNVIGLNSRRPDGTAVLTTTQATYTVQEVATLLGLSRANTYVLLRTGEIPARSLGSRWIIARHGFHVWLDSQPGDVTALDTAGACR